MDGTKIYTIHSVKQSAWQEDYIAVNRDLRKNAETDYQKDLRELMNNCLFGIFQM